MDPTSEGSRPDGKGFPSRLLAISGRSVRKIGPGMMPTRTMGLAMVEFVIVAPLLLLLLFGVIDVAYALKFSIDLMTCAQAGALYGYKTWFVGQGAIAGKPAETNIISAAANALLDRKNLAIITSSNVTVTKTCTVCPTGTSISDPLANCDTVDTVTSSVTCKDALGVVYGPPQIFLTVSVSKAYTASLTPFNRIFFPNGVTISRMQQYRLQ